MSPCLTKLLDIPIKLENFGKQTGFYWCQNYFLKLPQGLKLPSGDHGLFRSSLEG